MMITQKISEQLSKALEKMGIFETKVLVDKTKNIKFGDFYTNVAMTLSKRVNQSPLVVAKEIINNLDQDLFFKVNLQPPGFLNFTLKAKDHEDLLTQIYDQKDLFGQFAKKILLIMLNMFQLTLLVIYILLMQLMLFMAIF